MDQALRHASGRSHAGESSARGASVSRLLAEGGAPRIVFQPVVELASGEVVGYEALARGPAGGPLESPTALFELARREGVLAELDQACREKALGEALSAGLGSGELLFVNVEPGGLSHGGVLDRCAESELKRLTVVVELTERALAARPSEVLGAVRWLRRRGCRIALDDVGTDRRSLALMPFLSPEVIKLDLGFLHGGLEPDLAARILNAVGAEAERSGAVIVAEGIETEKQRREAIAMGATLGQGWHLGRPGPAPRALPASASPRVPRRPAEAEKRETPFERVNRSRPVKTVDKRFLHSVSRRIEREARRLGAEAVLLSAFQHVDFFDRPTRLRYEGIARIASMVGALGVGMPAQPGGRIRGANLRSDDPLRGEWDVIVVGPHFAAALVAKDAGDGGADLDRRFEYCLTYDRELVTEAARPLLREVVRVE